MHNPTPPVILILFIALVACGDDPAPAPQRRPAVQRPAEDPSELEERSREAPRGPHRARPQATQVTSSYESGYRHPESLLKPMDGFPLLRGTHLVEQGRDLATYEVQSTLGIVEAFYQERGFRITRPGKLPGLIVTRTDSGTRLQVQTAKHRMILLRFYR